MIWTDSPCWITCWNDSNTYIRALRSIPRSSSSWPSIPGWRTTASFADLILPVNTKFEMRDIGTDTMAAAQFYLFLNEEQCIEPRGRVAAATSTIVAKIAEKLGLLEEYTSGKTVEENQKLGFEGSGVDGADHLGGVQGEEYYVVPAATRDRGHSRPACSEFRDDPEEQPAQHSHRQARVLLPGPGQALPRRPRAAAGAALDREGREPRRAPQQRAGRGVSAAVHVEPPALAHARPSATTSPGLREIATMKVKGPDGYQYEPVWINPAEAAPRGIAHGDIVKIFNERGTVLGGAYVTERVMPGVVYMDHGARWDPIIPGELDRGGAINTITPHNVTSKNATGMVVERLPGRGGAHRPGRPAPPLSRGVRPAVSRGRRAVPGAGAGRQGGSRGGRRRRGATLDRRGRRLMGKVMIIDLALCNGCHNCQVACKDEHCANDWSPIARPQPDTGQFWNKVVHLERGSFPKVQVTYHHTICQHCEDAPCLAACPSNAIYRRDDGIVIIDPGKCCGNKMCIAACPYEGVIFFNEHLNMAQKCTFCAHLLDRGWTEPRCSDACPTGAFTFGDDSDPATAAKIAAAELLKPELATRPRVYYLNLPKTLDRRRGLRPGGRRGHPGRHGDRHQHGDRRHRHGDHRPLRRLLAEGPGRGQLHAGRREGRLRAASASARWM